MENLPPLIHIGYVKTGSTWLQKHLLKNNEIGFTYIAERGFLTHNLIKPYELYYDSDVVREHVERRLENCRRLSNVPVISHERLAGNPISGGYDNVLIANRLHELFPNARILIVIREQRRMMLSIYKEYINGGGASSLKKFIFPPDGAKIPLFCFEFFEFHKLIAYYQKLFSVKNVCVLPFELFSEDKERFCSKIIEFGGGKKTAEWPSKKVRVSSHGITTTMRRICNYMFYRDNSNPSAWFHLPKLAKAITHFDDFIPPGMGRVFDRRLQKIIDEAFQGRFIASNRITASITGLNLMQYDYMT